MYKVLIQHEFHKDVAKSHRVGQNTISRLVNKAKKNKGFISQLLDQDEKFESQQERMGTIIEDLNN